MALNMLDEKTRELMTASYAVPDLEAALQQVMYNAIDAHAKTIKVSVDVANASFTVVDDGDGMQPDDLCKYIGQCFASSRLPTSTSDDSQKIYGSRGAFLYELVALATAVEIDSRVREHWSSHRKVFKDAEVVFKGRSKNLHEAPGTKVSVLNLFGKLPVRQKDLSRNAKYRARVIQNIQNFCASMSMIWPSLSFDIRFKGEEVRPVTIPAAESCHERFLAHFGPVLGNELQYVSFSSETSQFSIRGYFAFIPGGAEGFGQGIKQAKSYYQFAFLENEWVEECRQLCSKVITDAALDISSAIPIFVLKVEAPSDCYGVSRIGKKDRILFKRPEEFRKFLVEFVQNLAATDASQPQNLQKPNCYDVPLHILPNDQPVFNLEEEEQALHDLGCSLMLHPVSSAFPPSLTSQGSDWSAHENLECLGYDLVFQDEHQEAESHVVWSNGDLNFCQACGHMSNVRTTQENTEFEGNDPNSQIQSNYSDADIYPVLETSEANNTLDFVIQDSTQTYADADTKSGEMQHIFFSKESMVMSRKISGTAEQETGTKTPWLCSKPDTYDCADAILDLSQDSTNSEDNVANVNRTGGNGHQKEGKLVQLAVTAKSRDGDNFLPSHHGADVKSNYFDLRTGVQVENSSLRRWLSSKTPPVKHFAAALQVDNVHVLTGDRSVKISKATLAKLQVIRQVDRKFILVQADTSRGKLLLCIDQHAADERVRLESLEEEMFGRDGSLRRVEIYNHGPPLTLRMNFKEREVLLNYGDLIRSWGFAFECVASNPDTIFSIRQEPAAHESSRVLLYATPKVEKRVANAHDFRDFIELLSNAGEIYSHSRIRPPVITRLLHSRACRSAIMFGDRLSIGQCKDLIEELKTCQLPFQCAHGRPSVVPLAEIHSDTLHQ